VLLAVPILALFLTCSLGRALAQPAELTPGAEAVRTGVAELMAAQDAAVASGDIPGFVSYLAPQAFWIGAGAAEVLVGPEAVAAELQQVFGPFLEAGATFSTEIDGPHIGVAADGRAAWVAEQITLTITTPDTTMTLPYRITSLVAESGGSWSIIAQKWSMGISNEDAFALAAQGALPTPAEVPHSVGDGAQPLVDLLDQGAADATAWVASLSEDPQAFSFGSAPDEVLEGGETIKQAYGAFVADYGMTIGRNGGVHAALAPSGTVGFIGGNLDIGLTVEQEGEPVAVSQTYRALLVYEKAEDGSWNLVQSHFSNAIE
jgi:ketosteroid isomerase-like protein